MEGAEQVKKSVHASKAVAVAMRDWFSRGKLIKQKYILGKERASLSEKEFTNMERKKSRISPMLLDHND